MPENPTQAQEGWFKPASQESTEKPIQGAWFKPSDALSPEALDLLRQNPPSSLPEPEIGTSPITTGAWYRPEATEASEAPVTSEAAPAQATGLFDYIAKITDVGEVGQFDPAKSSLLQGLQPDLGQFDSNKSGQLAGIGAEPIADPTSAFDPSKSSQLEGLGTAEVVSTFDASKSGQLEGLGSQTNAVEPVSDDVGKASNETASPSETQAQAAPVTPDQYSETEQRVTELRQQYQAGQITRQQLQDQLRQQMVLDDAGRWWMLGLESNKWYRFDGKDWIPDNPPRQAVVAGSAVTTETGMQQVPGEVGAMQVSTSGIQLDEHGMPLPNRVPVDDPQATLVNQRAVSLDEHRSWEAPTQQNPFMVTPGGVAATDATVPAIPSPAPQGQEAAGNPFAAVGMQGQAQATPAQPPRPRRKMNGIQPDYSAAFSGYWDRGTLTKWVGYSLIFGVVGGGLITFLVVVGMIAYYMSIVSKYSGAIDTLGERASTFETTIIYDSQGNVIAEFNDPNSGARKSVTLDEISPFLIHATISTEDETYYENPGFSLWGIGRAIYQNLRTRGAGGGASTITQQLARALVLDAEFASQRTATRKIEEIIVAAEIARQYDKNQILAFYLNEIYYGNQAYGIQAASELYFQKPASDLNVVEAAFLAGLPQSPAIYDPVVNRTGALARMSDVLRLMSEANGTGCITMQHGDPSTRTLCISESFVNDDNAVNLALVQVKTFQPPTYAVRYPHFVNYVRQELEREYGSQRIYTSGFRVYTTLVPSVQDTAQQAVLDEIPITPGADNGSVIAIRPSDGAVLAMVGSANFSDEAIDGQVNVAFTPQQPGSTMKPFVYLGAIEGNSASDYWYPGTIIWDVPSCFSTYCPTNYDFSVNGPMTMRLALVRSMNVPAVKGLAYITPPRLTQIMERFQVRLPGDTPDNAGLPSALGAVDVYLFDMTAAYAALANGGVYHNPYGIARIENNQGEVVYEAIPGAGVPVARPEHVYLVSDMLSDPTIREAASLSVPGWRTAAKTGTTNDNRDVLTIGYTSDVAVGVWVGRTDNRPMGSTVFGSNTAAPIWNRTMQAALAGITAHDFPIPQGVQRFQVCPDTGAQYSSATCSSDPVSEVALATQPPPSAEQGFITILKVDSFSNLLANDNCPEFVVDRSFINITDETAITWINTNAAGQAWAQARNIQTPIAPPPTESCTPGMPRPQITISQPGPNASVSGLTEIRGTVNFNAIPFQNFEFQLANLSDPTNFTRVSNIVTSQQPNPNGPLSTIDFSPYAPGNYILRLVARGQNNAQVEIDLPVKIDTFAPTPILPTPTFAPTLTPDGSFFAPTQDPFQSIPPTVDPFLPVAPTATP
jgi:membrane peptidoglycan carboxypeptidase